ncbi:hypothetical protein R6Q57_017706 [Mikania cordata]
MTRLDQNAESNADVGFDSQASYEFVYDDSKQSNPEEAYEEKPAASNVNCETKEKMTLGLVWPRRAALDRWPVFALVWPRRVLNRQLVFALTARRRSVLEPSSARTPRGLACSSPWTCLFELAELPTYRLITVEFLSTFRYRAHQAAVQAEEDVEFPPDIEFSLCGLHFEMSIERFAVNLGIYYEPETVLDDFGQGLTQGGGGYEGLVGPDI